MQPNTKDPTTIVSMGRDASGMGCCANMIHIGREANSTIGVLGLSCNIN